MINTIVGNPSIIYTFLWCVYHCQGILYPSGSVLSQFCLFAIIIMSLYFTLRVLIMKYKPEYITALLLMMSIFIIYGVAAYFIDGPTIKGLSDDSSVFNWFKILFSSILPVFAYYYFSLKKYITAESVKKWLPLFVIITLFVYYHGHHQMIVKVTKLMGHQVEEVTNNAGYFVLSLLPLFLLVKNKLIQYTGLFFCAVFILFAMKRGAILIGILLLMLMIYRSIKHTTNAKKVLIVLTSLISIIAICIVFSNMLQTSSYLQYRIESTIEGKSSGRDDIFSTLWNYFLSNPDMLKTLIGNGAWATTKITWTAAHNDWLEILIDMGIMGVCFYVYYWYIFGKTILKSQLPSLSRFGIMLVFLNMFFKTIFSMSFTDMTFFHAIMLGLCLTGRLKD